MVAEKRITDAIFDLEMNENSLQPVGQYNLHASVELSEPSTSSHISLNFPEHKLPMNSFI